MKRCILTIIDILHSEGAENVAVNIAVKLAESSEYNPVVCVTRSGGVLEKTLKAHNIKYYILNRHKTHEIHKFLPIKNIIKENKVSLIHAHKIGSNLWGSIIGKLFRIPVISHFHAHHMSLEKLTYLAAAKIIGSFSSKIISISEFERQRLIIEEGIPYSKMVTIYNGINYEKFQKTANSGLKRELGIASRSLVVGIVAAFRSQKNHELFILAANEILKRNQNVQFILIGDGATRGKIERMVLNLGIKNNFIFTNARSDIPDILSIIDVGVLSSHWEGLPLAVLEYMAASKPVVSTDVSGMSEVIENGVNGFLVPAGNFQALAEKITMILDNKTLAMKLGKNGFSKVKYKFSEEVMMSSIKNLYSDVISGKIIANS